VEVAWQSTTFIFYLLIFDFLMAYCIALIWPSPVYIGLTKWFPSELSPYPNISAMMLAPLFLACSSYSKTTIPHPSPSTKPDLFLSNGRLAYSGFSYYLLFIA